MFRYYKKIVSIPNNNNIDNLEKRLDKLEVSLSNIDKDKISQKIPKEFSGIIITIFSLFIIWIMIFYYYTVQINSKFLWGYFINIMFTLFIFCFVIFTSKKETLTKEEREDFKWLNLILLFISPNRFSAECLKFLYKPKAKKKDKGISGVGNVVIKLNTVDLVLSILTFLSISIYSYTEIEVPFQNKNIFLMVFFYAIIFRTVSRSFEIIIAFGKDCFEKKNDSDIVPQQRQILAVSSLIETIFNYASVYYIIGVEGFRCCWQSFVLSLKTNFFQLMNLNTDITHPDQASLLMMLQFMTSFTLIIFSIAMYASGNKKING